MPHITEHIARIHLLTAQAFVHKGEAAFAGRRYQRVLPQDLDAIDIGFGGAAEHAQVAHGVKRGFAHPAQVLIAIIAQARSAADESHRHRFARARRFLRHRVILVFAKHDLRQSQRNRQRL